MSIVRLDPEGYYLIYFKRDLTPSFVPLRDELFLPMVLQVHGFQSIPCILEDPVKWTKTITSMAYMYMTEYEKFSK